MNNTQECRGCGWIGTQEEMIEERLDLRDGRVLVTLKCPKCDCGLLEGVMTKLDWHRVDKNEISM